VEGYVYIINREIAKAEVVACLRHHFGLFLETVRETTPPESR
jgi:hypothetical protein